MIIEGRARCDSEGNLYLRKWLSAAKASNREARETAPVEEIKVDGTRGPEFSLRGVPWPREQDLTPDGEPNTSIQDFAVDPGGHAYLLVRRCAARGGACFVDVVRFGRDQSTHSVVELHGGPLADFTPRLLEVLPGGRLFVNGVLHSDSSSPALYQAIYNSDGKLHALVTGLPAEVPQNPPQPGTLAYWTYWRHLQEEQFSLAAGNGKGSIFLLRGGEHPVLYSVNENGVVLQHSLVQLPFQDAVPLGMSKASNGSVIIQFAPGGPGENIGVEDVFFSVIDARTGRILASLTADAKTDEFLGCASIPHLGFVRRMIRELTCLRFSGCFVRDLNFEFLAGSREGGNATWAIHFDSAH